VSRNLISDQLREALAREPSLYGLAAEAKISRQSLSRFVAGGRGLTLESVDRVAEALGLRLVQGRRRAKRT
jgi:DNA-binding phage protein